MKDWDAFAAALQGASDSEKLDAILELMIATAESIDKAVAKAAASPMLRSFGINL